MHKDLSHPTRATRLVSAGRPTEPGSALNVPLVPASNFIIGGKHEYARDDGTPTWGALEEIVGGLESGQAVAFASGMAAIAAVASSRSRTTTAVVCLALVAGMGSIAAADTLQVIADAQLSENGATGLGDATSTGSGDISCRKE